MVIVEPAGGGDGGIPVSLLPQAAVRKATAVAAMRRRTIQSS
jgi:hypothetical protein